MRILVADDDREIVELLNIYLHNEGYDVIKAYNGHQALSYIKNDLNSWRLTLRLASHSLPHVTYLGPAYHQLLAS